MTVNVSTFLKSLMLRALNCDEYDKVFKVVSWKKHTCVLVALLQSSNYAESVFKVVPYSSAKLTVIPM